MLPATLVTIASFLLKFCSSSPVYSMQPAYIIANIGTTGRNIRNLPCVSRKSNERGVCMFAIDCLKANGTHLGTCIDRFYFGSCCHIEPMHDIVGNTIDTAIIPSRQPPSRVSSTTTKISLSGVTEKTASNSTQTISTTPKPTTSKLTEKPTTIVTKSTTTATKTTTTKPTPSFGVRLTTVKTTAQPPSPTKPKPVVSSPKPSSTPLFQQTSVAETTEVSYKLTTFQTVEENTVHAGPITTSKFPKPTTVKTSPTTKPSTIITKGTSLRPLPSSTTQVPSTTRFRPRPTQQKLTVKPRPQSTTKAPLKFTKPPFKPIPISTRIPTKATKPTKLTTTKKPVVATKPPPTTARPISAKTTQKSTTTSATTTTKKPTTFQVTEKIVPQTTTKLATLTTKPTTIRVSTTKQPPSTTTTSPTTRTTTTTTTTARPTTISTATPTTSTAVPVSTTESNDLPVVSSVLEAVNGNPATNEIEQAKPLIPPPTTEETSNAPLVTWALVNEETTAKPATTLTQEWMAITTPDGWVLLPSLSTLLPGDPATTSAALNNTESNGTSSEKPVEVFTSTTTVPLNYSTEAISSSTIASPTTTGTALPVVSSTITNLIEASSTTEPSAVNMTDFTDVCGRRMYPEARIVGGERATFGKWPWQISLRQWRTSTYLHKCGAALLNENWAITAAHCVDNVPPSDLLLRLGEHDLSTDNEPYIHQERRVQIVASHPQFDPRTFEYDLALLRFYEPVQFQPNIIPVCVPNTEENFVGRTAYVTGWGRLYEDGPLPSVLQEVSVPVINNTVCESMYRSAGYIEHIPHIFICAGWRRGGFDSCEGDSGGPMVIQRPDKRFLLAGVISWGIGCAEPNQPGVYTRISEFRDWINQILQF